MTEWEIVDDNGCIYSGSENEMVTRFEAIVDRKKGYIISWKGDLKLVEIHAITR